MHDYLSCDRFAPVFSILEFPPLSILGGSQNKVAVPWSARAMSAHTFNMGGVSVQWLVSQVSNNNEILF